MEVRRLDTRDAESACELAARFLELTQEPAAMRAWLADERNVAVAAFADSRPVGLAYGYLLPVPGEKADMLLLYSIDVAEGWRRRVLGTQLVEALRRYAPDSMWLLTNASNEAAMALYEQAGGERPHPDDVLFRFPARPRVPEA